MLEGRVDGVLGHPAVGLGPGQAGRVEPTQGVLTSRVQPLDQRRRDRVGHEVQYLVGGPEPADGLDGELPGRADAGSHDHDPVIAGRGRVGGGAQWFRR